MIRVHAGESAARSLVGSTPRGAQGNRESHPLPARCCWIMPSSTSPNPLVDTSEELLRHLCGEGGGTHGLTGEIRKGVVVETVDAT